MTLHQRIIGDLISHDSKLYTQIFVCKLKYCQIHYEELKTRMYPKCRYFLMILYRHVEYGRHVVCVAHYIHERVNIPREPTVVVLSHSVIRTMYYYSLIVYT